MRSFDELGPLDSNKLEEMWNILLFEEADDTASNIEKDSLVCLIDMLFEEMSGKAGPPVLATAKAFASNDILDILQTVHQVLFKSSFNFEVKSADIEQGTSP